ncbi:MAG TPA: hypothetical protein VJ717_01450, partial [Gemmatimonadaceae bacterium]|nr:hypothetical protein [Gemmatimonadaceae bacterium]
DRLQVNAALCRSMHLFIPRMSLDLGDSPHPEAAHASAGWRVGAITAGWLVLALGLRPQPAVRLALDIGLAVGGWWALTPGRRRGGPMFLRNDHWTKFLAVPVLLGVVLTVLDLWRLIDQ